MKNLRYLIGILVILTSTATLSAQLVSSGQIMRSQSTTDVALGDLDGDGDLDAFITKHGTSPGNRVYLNDGNGYFTLMAQILGTNFSSTVALADLDGDNDLDAYVGRFGGPAGAAKVWFNDGNANFSASPQSVAGVGNYTLSLGDLDGDGDIDAVSRSQFFLNQGNGIFSTGAFFVPNTFPNSCALGDVDGDGDLDVLLAMPTGNLIALNNGNAVFALATAQIGSTNTLEATLGDLNGDSHPDMVFINAAPDSHEIRPNIGVLSFPLVSQSLANLSTNQAHMVDLDRDGATDLYFTTSGGPNRILLNDGNGIFSPAAGAVGARGGAFGDLNGNGAMDFFALREREYTVYFNTFPNPCDLSTCIGKPLFFAPDDTTATNTYTWDFGDGSTSTLPSPSHTYSTDSTYTVTLEIVDTNGCISTSNQVVCVYPTPTISYLASNPTCNGLANGNINVTMTGGTSPNAFSYLWSPGGATTKNLSGVPAGVYTLVATDNVTGCSETATITLTEPLELTALATRIQNITCYGLDDGAATVQVTGGTPPFSYAWTPNNSTNDSLQNLPQGTYSIIVTDSQGCTSSDSVQISEPLELTVNPYNTGAVCQGDSSANVISNPAGGTQPLAFDWNSGSYTTEDVLGIGAGVYDVIVTDNNGCSASGTTTVGTFPGTPATFQISQ